MQRITVTVPDDLLAHARAEVGAGRASSVSAWVASAMRTRAEAMAALDRDLDEHLLARGTPTAEEITALAVLTGLDAEDVDAHLSTALAQAQGRAPGARAA